MEYEERKLNIRTGEGPPSMLSLYLGFRCSHICWEAGRPTLTPQSLLTLSGGVGPAKSRQGSSGGPKFGTSETQSMWVGLRS